MRVQFTTNLGSRDAARFDLDHADCLGGATVDVPADIGRALIEGKFATEAPAKAAPKPAPETPADTPAKK